MEKFERNTTGFTADVELYDENSIIKIYRDYVPQKDIEREILCTQSVQNWRAYGARIQGICELNTMKARHYTRIPKR